MPGKRSPKPPAGFPAPASDRLREFLGFRFVYAVVSPRAHGLVIAINVNPDKRCNFDCAYCDVARSLPPIDPNINLDLMTDELLQMLTLAHTGELGNFFCYRNTVPELLEFKHVALSGFGEPTLSPAFLEVVRTVVHVRALDLIPSFKIVLVTNASRLEAPEVREALRLFTPTDEIWAKLDAGTQAYMDLVNRPDRSLEKIMRNILSVARDRPVIIQSLFPLLNNREPSLDEIDRYAERLGDLRKAGAQIPLVQIYSVTRPAVNPNCGHLSLKTLNYIAQRVRDISGLKAEVF